MIGKGWASSKATSRAGSSRAWRDKPFPRTIPRLLPMDLLGKEHRDTLALKSSRAGGRTLSDQTTASFKEASAPWVEKSHSIFRLHGSHRYDTAQSVPMWKIMGCQPGQDRSSQPDNTHSHPMCSSVQRIKTKQRLTRGMLHIYQQPT
jgi:hypothetical protein